MVHSCYPSTGEAEGSGDSAGCSWYTGDALSKGEMLEVEGREREGEGETEGTRNRAPETGPTDSFGKRDTYINGSEPISDETVRSWGNFSPFILPV